VTAVLYTSEQVDALLKPLSEGMAQMQKALDALQQQVDGLAPAKVKESKEGTSIAAGTGTIIDGNGDVWALTAATFIQKDGLNAYNNWQSNKAVYHSHTVYILGLDTNWYQWTGQAFVRALAPPV
jgi:hypothetical protein